MAGMEGGQWCLRCVWVRQARRVVVNQGVVVHGTVCLGQARKGKAGEEIANK